MPRLDDALGEVARFAEHPPQAASPIAELRRVHVLGTRAGGSSAVLSQRSCSSRPVSV